MSAIGLVFKALAITLATACGLVEGLLPIPRTPGPYLTILFRGLKYKN